MIGVAINLDYVYVDFRFILGNYSGGEGGLIFKYLWIYKMMWFRFWF